MAKTIKLRKGYNIKIQGEPINEIINRNFRAKTFSIKPTDFEGLSPIPKLLVGVGDEVKAGSPLFYDKKQPEVLFVSPVSGEIAEIKRGAKRAIAEIVILADEQNEYKSFEQFTKIFIKRALRKDVVKHLLQTGCWPFFRQRPYNVIADPLESPKAIFIAGFDSAPLAPDYNYTLKDQQKYIQIAIEAFNKLAPKVYLGIPDDKKFTALDGLKNIEVYRFRGPHPAGCIGVQIHHINPINKGEVVWTINAQDVVALGRTLLEGQYNTERLIAVGGPTVKKTGYVKTFIGANIAGLVKNNLTENHVRYISGNVLTGSTIAANDHLGFYDQQLSVIKEGDQYELFGWLIPNYGRPSISRTFPMAALLSNKKYDVNTNTHGEPRAMVVTGAYEKVTPMDIYPMQLIKSILYKDFDLMEGLGIYEVVEEDLALCEFVCPSKTKVQEILRDGLDYMRDQA